MKRNKRGITLIALIITIIVMLILVGVTVNLSANGDLFAKARTGSKDTEQRKILEELISMAEFDNDGKIQVNSLVNKVKAKYESSSYDTTSSKLTVTGNKGEYKYKVTDTEIKLWENLIASLKEGDCVRYKNIDWIVFRKKTDKIELITKEPLGEVTFGYKDTEAKEAVNVENENNLTDDEKIERTIWSYNNAINTLTKKCKELTGITTGIRNVGGPEEDETPQINITIDELEEKGFSSPDPDMAPSYYNSVINAIANLRKDDNYYEEDYEQMNNLNILETEENYWLSSRLIEGYPSEAYFAIRCINMLSEGSLDCEGMFYVSDGGTIDLGGEYEEEKTISAAVRPVISLNTSEIQEDDITQK